LGYSVPIASRHDMASSATLLLARILLATMFLASGYAALSDIQGTATYFAGLGLAPAPVLAWVVGIFELVAGILLVIGFQTRAVAVLLAVFTIVATYMGHYGQGAGDPAAVLMHNQALLKDVAVAGGMILLALLGAGRLSIDSVWGW
jgi:putative oxidoreductase